MAAKDDHARRPRLYFRHHPYFARSRIPILAITWLFLRSATHSLPLGGLDPAAVIGGRQGEVSAERLGQVAGCFYQQIFMEIENGTARRPSLQRDVVLCLLAGGRAVSGALLFAYCEA